MTWYSSPKGFQGLANFCSDEMTIDTGGTGKNLTTVWFVWWHPDGVQWIYGAGGSVAFSQPEVVDVKDPDKEMPMYRQWLEFYPGLSFQNRFSVGRIANVDVTSAISENGKVVLDVNPKILTDVVMRQALNLFPSGSPPNVIYMAPMANLLLTAGRSTLSAGKQSAKVAFSSSDYEGIPICYSEQIRTDEKQYVRPTQTDSEPEPVPEPDPETEG